LRQGACRHWAELGYKTVARHFRDIDTDAKGFVTENDIRAWHAMQKAGRQDRAAEDPLRPRPAFNRYAPDQRPTPGPSQTMLTTPQAPQGSAMVNLDHSAQPH
jgi:hypothetical protein